GDPGDEPTPATDLPATEPAEPAEPAQPARQGEDEQWERLRRVLVFAAWCLAVAAAGLVAAAVVQVDQFGRGSRLPVSVADRFVLLGQSVGPTIGMLAVGGGLPLTGVRALYAVPAKGAISLGLVVAVVVGGVGAGVDLVALAVRAAGWASQQLQRQQGAVGVLVESTGV